MTDKQPDALRLADELEEPLHDFPEPTTLEAEAAAELRRLHAENQALRTTHVQNPAEIEHVAGDVSKNGAGLNMNVYAELPQSVGDYKHGGGLYTDAQMRVFADATCAMRASHGQASAQADPADIIAGELQISRGHAYDLMRDAVEQAAPTTQPSPAAQGDALEPVGWFDDDRVFWHEGKQPAQGSDLYTTPQPAPAAQGHFAAIAAARARLEQP